MSALLVAPVVPPAANPLRAVCSYCTVTYREGRDPTTHGICASCERLLKTGRFDIGRCLDCGKAARGLFCSPQHRDEFLVRAVDEWGMPLVPQETLRPEGVRRTSPSVSPGRNARGEGLAPAGRRVTR
jgi:hypothetical protein